MTATATVTPITPPAGDPRIEAWLDAHAVTWTFEPQLPLATVDMKRSLQNQARPGEALIDDTVDLYVQGYRNGDQFPPLVVRRASARAKSVVVIDGNHRSTSATKAGLTKHAAYVIECADEVALLLSYDANLKNGAQLPRAQRIALAVHLVETGMTGQDAAKQMGVAPSEVSNQRTLNKAAVRATKLKVTGWDQIPQGTRLELARLDDEEVFRQAAALVGDTGMAAPATKDLVRKIKGKPSEAARLELIAGERDVRRKDIQKRFGGKISAGRGKRQTEFDRLRIVLASLQSINIVDVDESAPGPDARKKLRADLKTATSKLIDIDKAVK